MTLKLKKVQSTESIATATVLDEDVKMNSDSTSSLKCMDDPCISALSRELKKTQKQLKVSGVILIGVPIYLLLLTAILLGLLATGVVDIGLKNPFKRYAMPLQTHEYDEAQHVVPLYLLWAMDPGDFINSSHIILEIGPVTQIYNIAMVSKNLQDELLLKFVDGNFLRVGKDLATLSTSQNERIAYWYYREFTEGLLDPDATPESLLEAASMMRSDYTTAFKTMYIESDATRLSEIDINGGIKYASDSPFRMPPAPKNFGDISNEFHDDLSHYNEMPRSLMFGNAINDIIRAKLNLLNTAVGSVLGVVDNKLNYLGGAVLQPLTTYAKSSPFTQRVQKKSGLNTRNYRYKKY